MLNSLTQSNLASDEVKQSKSKRMEMNKDLQKYIAGECDRLQKDETKERSPPKQEENSQSLIQEGSYQPCKRSRLLMQKDENRK